MLKTSPSYDIIKLQGPIGSVCVHICPMIGIIASSYLAAGPRRSKDNASRSQKNISEKEPVKMIKIVMGLKGTGKTKTLIEAVNNAAEVEHGNVVCIEKGDKLKFDISHKVRLVNSDEFDIKDFDMFYGFLCGLVAGNYDITHIFIDSVMKICGEDDLKAFDSIP